MSKYASLPDIDSGADVFETPDVPQEHSLSRDSDSDDDYHLPRSNSPTTSRRLPPTAAALQQASENIDGDRIDPSEARRRFGAASAAAQSRANARTDQVRRPARRLLPSASVYTACEDPEEREKETPLERLRRLRLEMAELEEEVRRGVAEKAKDGEGEVAGEEEAVGKDGKKEKKKREVSPAVILQQLQLLRRDLTGLTRSIEGTFEAEGEKEPGTDEEEGEKDGHHATKAKQSSGLLAKLGLASASTEAENGVVVSTRKTTSEGGAGAGDGELEKRIAELEKLVGASEADVDETHPLPPPLLSTLSRLDHLLTLLTQPRHLDSISRRVKVLVSDLERIHESRRKLGDTRPLNVALAGGMTLTTGGAEGKPTPLGGLGASTSGGSTGAAQLPPDALQKLDSLFTLLPRLDPLLPLAPRLLTRLQSLSSLHASAASFGATLSTVRGEVERLGEGEKGLREVLEGLEGSLKENEERTKGNLEGLAGRVEKIGRRLDRLQEQK